jgi:hypothetical protein
MMRRCYAPTHVQLKFTALHYAGMAANGCLHCKSRGGRGLFSSQTRMLHYTGLYRNPKEAPIWIPLSNECVTIYDDIEVIASGSILGIRCVG